MRCEICGDRQPPMNHTGMLGNVLLALAAAEVAAVRLDLAWSCAQEDGAGQEKLDCLTELMAQARSVAHDLAHDAEEYSLAERAAPSRGRHAVHHAPTEFGFHQIELLRTWEDMLWLRSVVRGDRAVRRAWFGELEALSDEQRDDWLAQHPHVPESPDVQEMEERDRAKLWERACARVHRTPPFR
jgi:hypothetical protein